MASESLVDLYGLLRKRHWGINSFVHQMLAEHSGKIS